VPVLSHGGPGATKPDAAAWRRWGLDPTWSRSVDVTASGRPPVRWNVLDTGTGPRGTIVCVHGNPTWSYLWKGFLSTLSPDWRVIAVDQTGMGWSQRSSLRRLDDRVAELVAFCRQEAEGPLVLVAHDWGGPVAIGAADELDVRAMVLANTAVARPDGVSVPPLIAAARRMVDLACRRTPIFVTGTARMTGREHRDALRAPYRHADRREAVAEFVADIPLTPEDPSWATLARSAASLDALTARRVPLLLVWGGRDPVFHDRFLADLCTRAPHAHVHRFPRAGHLVPLDEPMHEVAKAWLDRMLPDHPGPLEQPGPLEPAPPTGPEPASSAVGADPMPWRAITAAITERAQDQGLAYSGPDGECTWQHLHDASLRAARHLVATGLRSGDRVAMLVPPGGDMLIASYAIWRAGAVVVVADRGLGIRGLRAALRGAAPTWVVGTGRTLGAATLLGITPGARRAALGRVPGAIDLTADLLGRPPDLPVIDPDHVAAIVHTSGATGPAKPVRYRHGALARQRDVVASAFAVTGDEAFTTSFAPFVLLGPALGVPCVLPDIDVTSPADLDFDRLVAACSRTEVGVAWLSPVSARRIVASAGDRQVPLRLVMLAGAPIDADLLRAITRVTGADVRAPYGMTEAMPITDGTDATRSSPTGGTATGWPLGGASVLVVPLDQPDGDPLGPGAWGELLVSAPWMYDGYDQRWGIDADATVVRGGVRFHRTHDVGAIDEDGRIFQLGRAQHVLHGPDGPRPCVAVEQAVAAALGRLVAAVGVGPTGTEATVIVVDAPGRLRLAPAHLTATVRAASSDIVAAVLEGPLPVDIRHQSKIDRTALAATATVFLAGR